MSVSAHEVEQALKALFELVSGPECGVPAGFGASNEMFLKHPPTEWESLSILEPGDWLVVPDLRDRVEFVESQELIGNEHLMVFRVGDQHFAKYGKWISYDGMYWSGDFREVRSEPVVETRWI
jgi:hypothetical protein